MDPSPSVDTDYAVIRIPTDSPRITDIATKYRDAKLAALVAEPTGFAVKHAEEVLHPFTVWKQRLAAPSTILICVASPEPIVPATPEEDILLSGEWVGMSTIRGPLPYSMYHLPESGQPVLSDPSLETRWHLCSLYTSHLHRNKGLARKMVTASIDAAKDQTRALEGGDNMRARVRLFCDPSKTFIVEMYKKMSFQEAGLCTLKEAFVANGDPDLIPEDTRSTEEKRWKWERRYGLAMERVLNV